MRRQTEREIQRGGINERDEEERQREKNTERLYRETERKRERNTTRDRGIRGIQYIYMAI
jgi:hypothetical protein